MRIEVGRACRSEAQVDDAWIRFGPIERARDLDQFLLLPLNSTKFSSRYSLKTKQEIHYLPKSTNQSALLSSSAASIHNLLDSTEQDADAVGSRIRHTSLLELISSYVGCSTSLGLVALCVIGSLNCNLDGCREIGWVGGKSRNERFERIDESSTWRSRWMK